MIYGIGTDIVEISRMKKIIERTPLFIEKVFTPGERDYCLSRKQSAQSFATRFAAKEAVLKAFGTGLAAFSWQDIDIVKLESGKPEVLLHGDLAVFAQKIAVKRIRISLSHSGDSAIAMALAETEEE